MTFFRAFVAGGLVAALPLRAVYAPIPEQEQGKDLTVSVRAGISYDTNLFGAPPASAIPGSNGPLESTIWTLAPRAVYNASVTDQTFLAAAYALTLDKFANRPGETLLDSHDLSLRVAHAFTKTTNVDVTEAFMLSRNPEALLAGLPLSPDQSFKRNQLDGRFVTPVNAKATIAVKVRSVYYQYRNATLGRSLDRIENIYGVSADYGVLPEVKAVAEYRHQDVYYRKLGEDKNKRSDYLMAGVDYELAKKLSLSGRVGSEWRQRSAERSTTAPYAEISGKYDYAQDSFAIFGYAYTLEETSDVARFNDSKVNRLFVNVQHSLTKLIVASGSLTYEPSQLQGRRGVPNADETTVRGGLALSFLPTKNWTFSANYDYDRVTSDLPERAMRRERFGANASFTF
jgi:hypothetical protein